MRFVTGPDPGGPPVAQAGDATVPDSPEVGMKRLNVLMTEMLAEVEKGDVAERKVEAWLLSLLQDMRAFREALAARKKYYLDTTQHILRTGRTELLLRVNRPPYFPSAPPSRTF